MAEVKMSFGDFIEKVAAKANLKVEKRAENLVVVPFDMGDGRFQQVFVRPMGVEFGNQLIIGFFSPALKMPKGQMLGQKTANDLLRRNSELPHGAWAIEKIGDEDFLVVFDTQIAQTMQAEEFRSSVLSLSKVADKMEKDLGVDVF